MGYYSIEQLAGLGMDVNPITAMIEGILTPLVQGGTSAYSTFAQQDVAKAQIASDQQQTQALLAQKAIEDANALTIAQLPSAFTVRNVAIGAGVLAAGLVIIFGVRAAMKARARG